ncbi:MAG: glycosyltransferase [Bacteroidota bacterium]
MGKAETNKPDIMVLIDWYEPGFRGGGPIRTVANFVEACAEKYHIRVVSTAFDFGTTKPYPNVTPNTWLEGEHGERLWYFDRPQPSYRLIKELLKEAKPDILYLQSMFSISFTLWPLIWHRYFSKKTRVILAPRGMFHAGAMRFSRYKKRLFLGLIQGLGLLKEARFQATDPQEKQDIKRWMGAGAEVIQAPNLPRQTQLPWNPIDKTPGELKLVFASRVHPKKNLEFLIPLLGEISGKVSFDIYGPVEGDAYQQHLQDLAKQTAPDAILNWHGATPPVALHQLLPQYHLSVLPTLGENFGHAVFEAWLAGVPVLISDQTPWRNLESRGIGWDLPLTDPDIWKKVLHIGVEMNDEEYKMRSKRAWEYARNQKANPEALHQIHQLFLRPA